ncbi:MAG TPA: LysR family transcriptional regulator [Paracoccaceae bacterium]|nr:LysR family transcriptional regulator [Paracoccaceae bacterium]
MHDIDTALLRTFVLLSETRSFSQTGALIGRSQSAVSGQMRRLEETLGRRLLDRDTRNVRLTGDGERLLVHARAMIAQADAMLARFRAPQIAGRVRFGSPEDFASAYLPDVLGAFAAAHPQVELHVSCQLTLPLVEEFEAGAQDLIIVKQDPGQPWPGARPLWRERLVWVGGPAAETDFAAAPRPLPLVLSPAPCVYRSRAAGALDGAHVAWSGIFTSPSFAGCVAAVRAGLGYAVVPQAMAPAGLRVMGSGWPPLAEAEIALLGADRPDPAVQALAAFLSERVTRPGARHSA